MRSFLFILFIASFMNLAGCNDQPLSMDDYLNSDHLNEPSNGQVFGGPSDNEIFSPYQGVWTIKDMELTTGMVRKSEPGSWDILIKGHIIRFDYSPLVSEIRLCNTKFKDGGIECEGWHHEDIYDPGDMSRVRCLLKIVDDELILKYIILESAIEFMESTQSLTSEESVMAPKEFKHSEIDSKYPESDWLIETYTKKENE